MTLLESLVRDELHDQHFACFFFPRDTELKAPLMALIWLGAVGMSHSGLVVFLLLHAVCSVDGSAEVELRARLKEANERIHKLTSEIKWLKRKLVAVARGPMLQVADPVPLPHSRGLLRGSAHFALPLGFLLSTFHHFFAACQFKCGSRICEDLSGCVSATSMYVLPFRLFLFTHQVMQLLCLVPLFFGSHR